MPFDKDKLAATAQERRLAATKLSSRLSAVEGFIKHDKPIAMTVDIFPQNSIKVELEDFPVRIVVNEDDDISAAFARALEAFRAKEVQAKVQQPVQLLSTDFTLAFDTDGVDFVMIDMEIHGIYPLVDDVLTAEVLNNNPVDD